MDLYASEWQTFRRITLPLVLPGHRGRRAAGVLAVASTTSSSRTSTPARTVTFPMYVWGADQRGIPPQVNVIGTAMFAIALLLVLASNVRRRRTARLA